MGGRALFPKKRLCVAYACGFVSCKVGFFPASRLLKNAYKQLLRGAARPGLKPRVYTGLIVADFNVGALRASGQAKAPTPKSRSLTPPNTRGFGMTRAGVSEARTTEEKPRVFPTTSGRRHRERPATEEKSRVFPTRPGRKHRERPATTGGEGHDISCLREIEEGALTRPYKC